MPTEINSAGVLGGGVMGSGIGPAIATLSFPPSLDDLKDVDLVVEAVPEDLELKKKVWAEVDGIVQPQAVFATNTSGLVIGELTKAVSEARRPRFIGMHWFSPAPIMTLPR